MQALLRPLAAALLASLAVPAFAAPDLVILVRHAEKAEGPGNDPPLTPEGQQRAQVLAQALAGMKLQAVITTQYQRTRQTGAPAAQAAGLVPQVVATVPGDQPAHLAQVVAAVQAHGGTVLVVGHSNTVTSLVAALGGPKLQPLCETSFQQVFVLRPGAAGAGLARLQYGAPSGAPGPDCL